MLRLGDGSAALSNASVAGFIEKYDITGAMVGTPIALPTAAAGGQHALTFGGTLVLDGELSLSTDGHYALVAGYDAPPGTASVASTTAANNNRVVGRIDAMGNVDTATAFNASFSASNVRGVASSDGINIWASGNGNGGTGGVWHTTLGSTGGTQILTAPNNMRWLGIFGGQLYGISGSANFTQVFSVGTGLPTTTGQMTTASPGMNAASPSGFLVFDLNPNVAGMDTIYLADDSSVASGGGIQKWTFDGTTWTKGLTFNPPNAAMSGTTGVRGLASFMNNGMLTILTVSSDLPTRVYSMVDDGSTAPTFTLLTTAATNTVYRGIAMSPQ